MMNSQRRSISVVTVLAYADRGWPVLPLWWPVAEGRCACRRSDCSKPGKHPLSRHGLHDASTDPAAIRRWWAQWPRANVGIRTGGASRLFVVDVDGRAGMESLRALRREHGPLPAAWVRTGSGGWHAYFELPADRHVPNSVGRLGPGLDVRADGGSIVAPPSLHASGGRYRWLEPGVEPTPAPDWLIELALPQPLPSLQPIRELVHDVFDRYALAAIHGEAEAVAQAPRGTRNHRLNVAAWRLGRLVAGGVVDEGAARDALLAAADAAGLPRHESVSTVRSGMTAGRRSPRQPARVALGLPAANDVTRSRSLTP